MTAKPRILYIEDDEALAQLTCEMLGKAGYQADHFADGQAGLAASQAGHYDLCVADIMMPRLDGYQLARSLRQSGSSMPIIFLSARVLAEDVICGFESGGNDYMRKPYSMEELLVRIRHLLGQPRQSGTNGDMVSIGRYHFRHSTLELRFGETVLTMSPRMAYLLHKMASAPDGVLNKRDILLEVWGDDNFFNGRSLDVFISKLRKLLAEDERVRIVNIRGVGYRLIG